MTIEIPEQDDSRDYRKEFEKSMAAIAASQERFDARSAELQERFDARTKRLDTDHEKAIAELAEIRAGLKETEKILKETAEYRKETEKIVKETARNQKETDRQMREVRRTFNSQWGRLMEALVEGRLVDVLKGRGIEVEFTRPGLTPHYDLADGSRVHREFDILAVNGTEIVVVEVKTTLTPKHVLHFVSSMKDIGKFYPYWADRRIYGAMAYIRCSSKADVKAEKNGLFVMRAVGEGAIITNSEKFKPRSFTGPTAWERPHLRAVPDF